VFWHTTPLAEMSPQQWDALCDGCGLCCLVKLEDEEDGALYFTDVVCRQLHPDTARCRVYARRSQEVPECLILKPEASLPTRWLPETCAYRLLAEGKDLPDWHPLRSGDPATVVEAGISVLGWTICEDEVAPEDLEDHVW